MEAQENLSTGGGSEQQPKSIPPPTALKQHSEDSNKNYVNPLYKRVRGDKTRIPASTGSHYLLPTVNPLKQLPDNTPGSSLPSDATTFSSAKDPESTPPGDVKKSAEGTHVQNPLHNVWVKKWSEKKQAPFFVNSLTRESVWVLPSPE